LGPSGGHPRPSGVARLSRCAAVRASLNQRVPATASASSFRPRWTASDAPEGRGCPPSGSCVLHGAWRAPSRLQFPCCPILDGFFRTASRLPGHSWFTSTGGCDRGSRGPAAQEAERWADGAVEGVRDRHRTDPGVGRDRRAAGDVLFGRGEQDRGRVSKRCQTWGSLGRHRGVAGRRAQPRVARPRTRAANRRTQSRVCALGGSRSSALNSASRSKGLLILSRTCPRLSQRSAWSAGR